MLSDTPIEDFQIESFEPRHLKKARESLDKHLKAVEAHAQTNDEYKHGILKEPTLWEKIKHALHVD
ncbi:MAG TPA: hypothetical protein ENK98_05105 [Epsilonproteobacteria bacterium]|nr:hypothetical protein [Campylobacterota bacterium]HHD78998.1 hypothetical protein [Campylobacterota bacterium]